MSRSNNASEPVAVIGLGCRFPGALGPAALWALLENGSESVGPLPAERARGGRGAGGPSARGGFLDHIDLFDARFFGISPREAERLDPQQRLLLEVTWEALEDAGVVPARLDGSAAGVFIGLWINDYETRMFAEADRVDFHMTTGSGRYTASGRLSHLLGLRGPSVTVDTACSSSLVAVHLACQSLWSGESEIAIAGGANVILEPHITAAYSLAGMLSADGRCKFGDARADGYVRSEGVGVVVLKPLARARADRDPIRAVILGGAVNNDGHTGGSLGTPGRGGQEDLLRKAYQRAQVRPAAVDYVEAHGTGTRAGDPVELTALGTVLREDRPPDRPCLVGSLKSNIGHTEGAAGVAGLIKVVLALEHRMIPASLHCETPTPAVAWDALRLGIVRQKIRWPEGPRPVAGVSSFGIGGTNAHLVLAAPEPDTRTPQAGRTDDATILPLSARSAAGLREQARRCAEYLADPAGPAIGDVTYTAAVRRTHHEHRLAVVGSGRQALADRLRAFLGAGSAVGVVQARDTGRSRIAFVFPGQGSQWPGMGCGLLDTEPPFREAIVRCDRAIAPLAGWSLRDVLADPQAWPDRIDVIQPVLFAIQVALAEQWRAWGVEPTAVVGHSMGEVAAAHVAGILSLEDASRVICARSGLLRRISGRGAMAVVELSMAETGRRLRGREDRLSIAVCNSDRSTVVAGDVEDLGSLVEELERDGVFCRRVKVDVASHSPQVEPLRTDLLHALQGIRPTAGRIPMCSTVTGETIDGARLDAGYWMRNLRETVQFSAAVRRILKDGAEAFVEISPHPVLLPAIEQSGTADRPTLCLASMRRDEPERTVMLESLGALYTHGYPVDWARLTGGMCVRLPSYPWQRERFWYPIAAAPARRRPVAGAHALLDEYLASAADPTTRYWQGRVDGAQTPWLLDHRVQGVAVLPASAILEMALHGGAATFGRRCGVGAVRFESPLVVGVDHASILQLVVSSTRPGSATFRLASRAAESEPGDPWIVHATGTLGAIEPVDDRDRVVEMPRVDLEPGARHYEAVRRRGLDYGPAFQGVLGISRLGAEVITRVRETDVGARERDAYAIHPTLLDACLQGAVTTLEEAAGPGATTYVPTGLQQLTLRGRAAEARELWCRVRPRPGAEAADVVADIDVADDAGRVLVEVIGLRLSRLADPGGRELDRCLFEVQWRRTPPLAAPPREPMAGRWIVLGGERGVAGPLVEQLTAQGAQCSPDLAGAAGGGSGPALQGVVDLRALDAPPPDEGAQGTESLAEAPGVCALLDLVRTLAGRDTSPRPRLILVTAGVHDVVSESGRVGLEQAPLWGAAAVVAAEHPELRCTRVDLSAEPSLDEIEALARECGATDREGEVALRHRDRFVARLVEAARDGGELETVPAGDTPFRTRVAAVPTIDGLRLRAAARPRPGPGQVEIEVRAVGLNFRDVLSAIGSLPGHPGGAGSLGIECSGRVVDVGEGVSGVSRGDEVIAIALDCLGTHARADARLVTPRPAALTYEVAATVPIAFMTAWLALHGLAGLRGGDRVLIHAAAGGVGLAAVQIAQRAGATVFATAGTPGKREHLRRLGVEHVFDSRALSFATSVMERTRGAGVDIVLNSLAGEAVDAGLSVLAPYGRFVELGKRDIYRNAPMALGPFRANLSYSALDLERMCHERPEVVGTLLREVVRKVADGELDPLPLRVYPIAQLTEAFRYMAEARHIGRIALSLSPDEVRGAPMVPSGVGPAATYLITGGLGSLGLATAGALVEAGARHLVLVGRRPPGDAARRAIAALEQQGAEVATMHADVAVPDEISRVLAEVRRRMPPLRGVVHAAGVLSDATVLRMTAAELRAAMAPKAAGAWVLHTATASDPLDFFVMFSSAAALLGLAGQANYAAANAFLDALARHRRRLGRPALSIGWGPWAEVGLAAQRDDRGQRLAALGLGSLSPGQGVEAFRRAVGGDRGHVAVMALDPGAWCQVQPGPTPRLFEMLRAPDERGGAPPTGGLLPALRAAPTAARRSILVDHLRGRVARILRLEPSQVDPEAPLKSMGLDSLMALELRNRLEADLGQYLSATLVWNHPTIVALAAHFVGIATLETDAPATAAPPDGPDPELSVSQVTALLDEELGRVGRLLATEPEGRDGRA